jgi:hypothetical protein
VTEGLRTRPNPYNTISADSRGFWSRLCPVRDYGQVTGSISHRDEKADKIQGVDPAKIWKCEPFSRLINYLFFCEPRCNFGSAFRLTSHCTSTERTSQIISKTVGMENQMTSACDFTSPFLLSEHRDGVGRSTGTREAESEMGKMKR